MNNSVNETIRLMGYVSIGILVLLGLIALQFV